MKLPSPTIRGPKNIPVRQSECGSEHARRGSWFGVIWFLRGKCREWAFEAVPMYRTRRGRGQPDCVLGGLCFGIAVSRSLITAEDFLKNLTPSTPTVDLEVRSPRWANIFDRLRSSPFTNRSLSWGGVFEHRRFHRSNRPHERSGFATATSRTGRTGPSHPDEDARRGSPLPSRERPRPRRDGNASPRFPFRVPTAPFRAGDRTRAVVLSIGRTFRSKGTVEDLHCGACVALRLRLSATVASRWDASKAWMARLGTSWRPNDSWKSSRRRPSDGK